MHLWHRMKHASNLDPAPTGNRTWVHWLEAQHATTELGPLASQQGAIGKKINNNIRNSHQRSQGWCDEVTEVVLGLNKDKNDEDKLQSYYVF